MTHTMMPPISYCSTRNQDGMALLTILLMVVAITVVAGAMIASQGMMIRQYDLLKRQDQLLQDVKAGEQLAVDLIQIEAKVNDTDSLEDAWAQPQSPFTLGQHDITISIRDEASRFNINNLYHDGNTDEVALGVLQRLLAKLGLDEELALAVLDWQDPDNELSKGEGVETELYAGEGVAIANQPFLSVDALGEVSGFDAETLAVLAPYVTAVPYYLPINVNTADDVLLSALVSNKGSSDESDTLDNTGVYEQQTPREVFARVEDYMATLPKVSANSGADVSTGASEGQSDTQGNDSSAADSDTLKGDNTNKGKADDDREALATLLSVDSQAFAVLIDVTVDDKHRYATTFVSKVPLTQSENRANSDSSSSMMQYDAHQSSSKRVIQAFGTRLWTYRPSFEYGQSTAKE